MTTITSKAQFKISILYFLVKIPEMNFYSLSSNFEGSLEPCIFVKVLKITFILSHANIFFYFSLHIQIASIPVFLKTSFSVFCQKQVSNDNICFIEPISVHLETQNKSGTSVDISQS